MASFQRAIKRKEESHIQCNHCVKKRMIPLKVLCTCSGPHKYAVFNGKESYVPCGETSEIGGLVKQHKGMQQIETGEYVT